MGDVISTIAHALTGHHAGRTVPCMMRANGPIRTAIQRFFFKFGVWKFIDC